MSAEKRPQAVGRGAQVQPANRFLAVQQEDDWEHVAEDEEYLASLGRPPTVYLPDDSQSIVSENNSPDIPFRYSINPYRGCAHGCSYCYARPTHEYLGLSAGLDFETKVMVKHRAPELLRKWLARPRYEPQPLAFSGVTDCYQPAEREFRLTRGCLEVAVECRQPVGIVTKNALVTRDLDLLIQLAEIQAVRVAMSLTTLDAELSRKMEPRTSTPDARLRTIETLSSAGVPTYVMTAPIIPGLNDCEIPALLAAASDAGASGAGYTVLRLPYSVVEVFFEWLDRSLPSQAEKVRNRISDVRGGKHYDARFGHRMRGTGIFAEQIGKTFQLFAKQHELDRPRSSLDVSRFQRPRSDRDQLRLF
ncbi:MAG: PA0069 family radical SAM protein [Planctomycetota bacterium]